MADLFGCVGVSFEIIDKKTLTPVFMELGKRIDIEISQEYLSYYGAISPRVAFSGDLPVGDIAYDHRFMNEAEMDADEFYCDLMAPLGLRYFVSGHILNSDSHTAVIAAQRSPAQGHFGERDFALMRRLMPVVRQAMDLRFRLKGQERQTASFLEGLEALGEAALLIGPTGRVMHMNAVATALFADNGSVGVANGALHFSDTTANDNLDNALNGLAAGTGAAVDMAARNFVVRRPNKDRPLLVSVRSMAVHGAMAAYRQFTAIVLIRDPAVFVRLDTALLMRSYALSVAEAEIAQAFDLGLTLQDIARQRSVAISTVRSQLYSLMAKLSVSNQAELARLLRQYGRAF